MTIQNRTIFTGDNLDIMRGMNSNIVDLIYLDPPFNSNKNYSAPIGSKAAGAAFKDTWTLSDIDEAWHGEIAEHNQALYEVISASRHSHGKGMMSYLIMMGVRLLEMKRILKPTGSIYLHCDPTASHYLKMLMDSIFIRTNYRTHKHQLYGKQEGNCFGCIMHFPFRNLTVDHIVPKSKGGQDNYENLQLLCGACNSIKGNRPHEYLVARLRETGIRP